MKNAFLLSAIIVLSISCKSDKNSDTDADLTVDEWTYEKGSSSDDDSSPDGELTEDTNDVEAGNKSQNPTPTRSGTNDDKQKNDVAPVNRKVTIDNSLVPFSTAGALKFLELEGLKIGMAVKELEEFNIKANQNLERKMIKTGNGSYEAFEITKGGVAVLHLIPTGDKITQMMFVGANSTPNNMAGVGTNFGSLKATYPNLGSTTSTTDLKIDNQISLKLQADDRSTKGKPMSDAVTVVNIIVK